MYGGQTITLPTIEDLNEALNIVNLYKEIEVDGKDYEQAVIDNGCTPAELYGYNALEILMRKYEPCETRN